MIPPRSSKELFAIIYAPIFRLQGAGLWGLGAAWVWGFGELI